MTDDIHQLTAAYALDAVDAEERAFFERHLFACESCRAEVAQFHAAASQLGAAAEQAPPESMRASVLTTIAETPQEPSTASGAPRRPGRLARLLPAVAAVLLVAVGGLGAAVAYLLGERPEERTLAEIVETADTLALVGEEGQRGMLLHTQDEAVLLVDDLDPLPADETYQAWVIHDEVPESAGTFSTEPDGSATLRLDEPIGTADAVAVSHEQAGGADEEPQGPVVLIGERPPADDDL